jgi:carbon-monoxide dehydrogenase large subunit
LADYLVPTICEIPPIDVVHVQSSEPDNVGGFRGVGEGGTIGAPGAIANAIADALSDIGISVNELPATPERLFRLVKGHSSNSRGGSR